MRYGDTRIAFLNFKVKEADKNKFHLPLGTAGSGVSTLLTINHEERNGLENSQVFLNKLL